MIVKEIKVGGLLDFIKSQEYNQLDIKPITTLRAISQYNNPFADKNDIALVYASDKNILLGFVGLLPDSANDKRSSKIHSNTGWWVNEKHGKNIGLPLFLKAVQLCDELMFFTDCTNYTKTILEKTGLFTFSNQVKGKRYFLRFYMADLILKKTKSKIASQIFALIDFILNFIIQTFEIIFRKKTTNSKYSIRSLKTIDKNLKEFISNHSENFILTQSVKKLNWIVQFPWITQSKDIDEIRYPFTHVVNSFNQDFLVIEKNKQTVALFLLSIRDKHAQIPYFYCESKLIEDVAILVLSFLSKKKINSLIIFNPELNKAFEKIGFGGIYKKDLYKFTGLSTGISHLAKNKVFQDGEGDIAFT